MHGIIVGSLVGLAMPSWSQGESGSTSDYSVTIAPDISPRMQSGDVVAIVLDDLAEPITSVRGASQDSKPPRIVSVVCLRGSDVGTRVPNGRAPRLPYETVWFVRGEGRFVKTHLGGSPMISKTGFVIIDDATGDVVGRGAP